jgi:hypothetical protein
VELKVRKGAGVGPKLSGDSKRRLPSVGPILKGVGVGPDICGVEGPKVSGKFCGVEGPTDWSCIELN